MPKAVTVQLQCIYVYVTDLQTQDIMTYVSNLCLLNIYNLPTQMYVLAKFQLHMPVTFGVLALEVETTEKLIYTVSMGKYRCLHKWL